jgi:hypothetical protein
MTDAAKFLGCAPTCWLDFEVVIKGIGRRRRHLSCCEVSLTLGRAKQASQRSFRHSQLKLNHTIKNSAIAHWFFCQKPMSTGVEIRVLTGGKER